MRIFASTKLFSLAVIITSLFLFQNCPKTELIDCVGKLNPDVFHFIGTHDISGRVYVTQIPVDTAYSGDIPHDSASIVFKEDGAFRFKINIISDTSRPFYEYIWEYINLSGQSEELIWEGTWELAQGSKYRNQCDILTDCTGITYIIHLNSLIVPEGIDMFNELACDFSINCAIRNIRFYFMNVSLPLYDGFEIGFVYGYEENVY